MANLSFQELLAGILGNWELTIELVRKFSDDIWKFKKTDPLKHSIKVLLPEGYVEPKTYGELQEIVQRYTVCTQIARLREIYRPVVERITDKITKKE